MEHQQQQHQQQQEPGNQAEQLDDDNLILSDDDDDIVRPINVDLQLRHINEMSGEERMAVSEYFERLGAIKGYDVGRMMQNLSTVDKPCLFHVEKNIIALTKKM